jgi:hydroxymethylbilane synthase
MTGFVASVDGERIVKAEVRGDSKQAENLGKELAGKLISQGADKILAELDH